MKRAYSKIYTYLSVAFVLGAALAGCIPGNAKRTTRPNINTSPFSEKKIQNPQTGNWYSYMFLAGPREDAPSVVLLHGGIFDNRIWLNFDKLAERYNVYAPLYPDSSPFYTGAVADWGKVVTDFTEAVGIKPELLVGVSNGAYGAIEYLTQNQTDAKGLVLISTAMLSSSEAEIKKRTRMGKFALRLAPGKLQGLVESRAAKTEYAPAPGNVSQKDIFYVRQYPYYYQLFSVPVKQGSKKQDTHKIKLPVLVLHGTDDDIMPAWTAKDTVKSFDNATLKQFDGEGHDMTFGIGPKLCQTILEFFPK